MLLLVLAPLLSSADLKGIGSFKFRQELREGEQAARRIEEKVAETAELPSADTDHAGRSIAEVHALFDVPDHLRDLANYDPNVALAGLRIELERALRRVFVVLYPDDDVRTLTHMIRLLEERGRLDDEQADLARSMIRLGNRAAHGEPVTESEAREVFGWADTLNRSFGVGYSLNFAPNLDFEEQGLVCEFEHCIENMPLRRESSDESCPMWGHDCPGGRRRIATCPAAQEWRADMERRAAENPDASRPAD